MLEMLDKLGTSSWHFCFKYYPSKQYAGLHKGSLWNTSEDVVFHLQVQDRPEIKKDLSKVGNMEYIKVLLLTTEEQQVHIPGAGAWLRGHWREINICGFMTECLWVRIPPVTDVAKLQHCQSGPSDGNRRGGQMQRCLYPFAYCMIVGRLALRHS